MCHAAGRGPGYNARMLRIPHPCARRLIGTAVILAAALAAEAQVPQTGPAAPQRQRVLVLTDVSNEPDDEESLVRFLVYSNEYDVEGLVATTSCWLRDKTREDLIRRQIEAYGRVRDNLLKHAAGFPTAEHLSSVTATGQGGFGMAAVGDGKGTAGSRRVLEAADRAADDRPLWVSVWGGANTLAQALWDARRERPAADVDRLVRRLRVYAIADQDDAGPWLRREFPGLFYVVSPTNPDGQEYHRATWTGISGDRHYRNGPMHRFALVGNPWLQEHVIDNHGPLGALYPKHKYIMEGDTPAFLGLIDNGLGWHVSPEYGGWGGRYVRYRCYGETRPIWTNSDKSRDTVTADDGRAYTSDQATVWRWREHFQHDFAARMDWCVAGEYRGANHNPVAVLNGDASKRVVELRARAGETVRLSAAGSGDPDGDRLTTTWFVYREAGSYAGQVGLAAAAGGETSFAAPAVDRPRTVHVILQVADGGSPSLFSYRRAVVTIEPRDR